MEGGADFHRRQKRRIEVPVVPAATTIYDLNNDLLAISHSLLGVGHFRNAGIACKLFLEASGTAGSDEKVTSMKIVTSSISCAEKYFEDAEGTTTTNTTEELKLFWYSAARYGRLEIMKWAHRQGYARVWSEEASNFNIATAVICFRAAKYGQLDVLQWLRENGCCWNQNTCYAAAKGGYLSILQWLRENGCPWNASTFSAAAKGGHLSILQWLRENGCPWNADTCSVAAEGGHLSCLQWLRENGCPWNYFTCSAAAQFGHLSCLQWARENGCPWNFFTCSAAASGGHLSCLQWARENGCPWNFTTCDDAALFAISPAPIGQKRMDVHGTKKHVFQLRDAAI